MRDLKLDAILFLSLQFIKIVYQWFVYIISSLHKFHYVMLLMDWKIY